MTDTVYIPGTFNAVLADRAIAIMNRAKRAEYARRAENLPVRAIVLADTDWAVLRAYTRMMAEYERPGYQPAFTPRTMANTQDMLFGIPVMPRSDVVVLYETED